MAFFHQRPIETCNWPCARRITGPLQSPLLWIPCSWAKANGRRVTGQQRAKVYGAGLERARRLLPAANDTRSARVMMRDPKPPQINPKSEFEPGYAGTLMQPGVVDHQAKQAGHHADVQAF